MMIFTKLPNHEPKLKQVVARTPKEAISAAKRLLGAGHTIKRTRTVDCAGSMRYILVYTGKGEK